MSHNLGRFCHDLGGGQFYSTLDHRQIDAERLAAEHMLAGQEEEAIQSRLLTVGRVSVLVVPSYECNLRCRHCYVGDKLKKPTGSPVGNTDPGRLAAFLRAHSGVIGAPLSVVGGEPLLHVGLYTQLMAELPELKFITTTNGVWEYGCVKHVFPRHHHLTFSFDGLPHDHNRIRKSVDRLSNVFQVSYQNLARVRRDFPDLPITVQGNAVDRMYSGDEIKLYRMLFARLGVPPERITFSVPAETNRYKSATPELMRRVVSRGIRKKPCCEDKVLRKMIVYNNKVYSSYHRIDLDQPIGTLEDSLEVLRRNYAKIILSNSYILGDSVCMTQCTAVGNCWGMCANQGACYTDGRPSSMCDRAFKEEVTRQEVAAAQLTVRRKS